MHRRGDHGDPHDRRIIIRSQESCILEEIQKPRSLLILRRDTELPTQLGGQKPHLPQAVHEVPIRAREQYPQSGLQRRDSISSRRRATFQYEEQHLRSPEVLSQGAIFLKDTVKRTTSQQVETITSQSPSRFISRQPCPWRGVLVLYSADQDSRTKATGRHQYTNNRFSETSPSWKTTFARCSPCDPNGLRSRRDRGHTSAGNVAEAGWRFHGRSRSQWERPETVELCQINRESWTLADWRFACQSMRPSRGADRRADWSRSTYLRAVERRHDVVRTG